MNTFPLTPLLVALSADGIQVTISDYDRISRALRTGGEWTIDRLRHTLLALLVRNSEQEAIFCQRFNTFFSQAPDELLSPDEVQRVLENIRKLLEAAPASPSGQSENSSATADRADASSSMSFWQRFAAQLESHRRLIAWNVIILVLIAALGTAIYFGFIRNRPQANPPVTPPVSEPPPDNPVQLPLSTDYTIANAEVAETTRLAVPRTWKDVAGVVILVLTLSALLIFIYQRYKKSAAGKPPEWNPRGRHHFSTGEIGGKPASQLASAVLDQLADSLGYFQSQEISKTLDVRASISAAGSRAGLPTLVFHKRRQLRTVYILEDVFAESMIWNSVSQELLDGLRQRGVNTVHGKFKGTPAQFILDNGSVQWLDDLEDQRRDYLLLLFSDGKGIRYYRDLYVLEALSRWPRVAWMELREPRFWDASTALIAQHQIPVFPATAEGLLRAMRYFMTERGAEAELFKGLTNYRGVPAFVERNLSPHLEYLLGDALLWAQACAMIQPISLGLADSLRRQFQPHLPPDFIQRLFLLPGTTKSDSGLRFSTPVLAILKAGFAIRWELDKQEEILRFLLAKIAEREPEQKDSLAHLSWEMAFERVRLELEPDEALKRLAALEKTPLGDSIRADLANVTLPGAAANGSGADSGDLVPLRLVPASAAAQQQLANLAKSISRESQNLLGLDNFASEFWQLVHSVIEFRGVVSAITSFFILLPVLLLLPILLCPWPVYLFWKLGKRIVIIALHIGRMIWNPRTAKSALTFITKRIVAMSSGITQFVKRGLFPLLGADTETALTPDAFATADDTQVMITPAKITLKGLTRNKRQTVSLKARTLEGSGLAGSFLSDDDWISLESSLIDTEQSERTIQVTIDPSRLQPGRHAGTIIFTGSVESIEIPVDVAVVASFREKLAIWWQKNQPSAVQKIIFGGIAIAGLIFLLIKVLGPNWMNRLYNHPPVLESFDVRAIGDEAQTLVFEAIARDPDDDPVSYQWETNEGDLNKAVSDSVIYLDMSRVKASLGDHPVEVRLKLVDRRGGVAYFATKIDMLLEGTIASDAPLIPESQDASLEVTAETENGQVSITRLPQGETVIGYSVALLGSGSFRLDSNIPWRKPQFVSVSAGEHKVVRPHFIPFPLTSVSFDLNIDGVKVSVDGVSLGQVAKGTPYRVPVGTHALVATKDGYNTWHKKITIASNNPEPINIQMQPAIGETTSGRVAIDPRLRLSDANYCLRQADYALSADAFEQAAYYISLAEKIYEHVGFQPRDELNRRKQRLPADIAALPADFTDAHLIQSVKAKISGSHPSGLRCLYFATIDDKGNVISTDETVCLDGRSKDWRINDQDEAAVKEAARQFKFAPAQSRGKPVRSSHYFLRVMVEDDPQQ